MHFTQLLHMRQLFVELLVQLGHELQTFKNMSYTLLVLCILRLLTLCNDTVHNLQQLLQRRLVPADALDHVQIAATLNTFVQILHGNAFRVFRLDCDCHLIILVINRAPFSRLLHQLNVALAHTRQLSIQYEVANCDKIWTHLFHLSLLRAQNGVLVRGNCRQCSDHFNILSVNAPHQRAALFTVRMTDGVVVHGHECQRVYIDYRRHAKKFPAWRRYSVSL